jgi:hypothetical protein
MKKLKQTEEKTDSDKKIDSNINYQDTANNNLSLVLYLT